jgi:DNA-binding transcriptional LysR family regulator
MDRLMSMEVFVAAVESGNFTAAANKFRITPAMVSKHVASLERRLGATLLARTTRTQKLTEIGRRYYENCKQILMQVSSAEAGAEAMSATPKGLLRVNASMWFGSLQLAPVVCDYLQLHPDVNIELSLTDRYVDIVEEGFDVAIRVGELKDSSLVARKVATFEVAICASPDYITRAGRPQTPKDLSKHQCLGFTNWNSHGGWRLLQKDIGTQTWKTPRFQSDNGQALRTAAVKGLGIIMMPKDLLKPDLQAGKLTELLKPYVPASRPISAVYPKERQMAAKLTSFVNFLGKALTVRQ